MIIPRTQKGRGVAAMRCYPPLAVSVPECVFVQREEQVAQIGGFGNFRGLFVRPCPPTPEHGYQESMIVGKGDTDAIIGMLKKTLEVFPESELMIMSPIKAQSSFVWTPGRIVVGRGTDGATSGGKVVCELPLVPIALPEGLLRAAGIGAGETPYIEGLVESGQVWLVQLRPGPEPPPSTDYIPQRVVVGRVIRAEGDLVEWGKRVRTLREGDVVEHVGGSLVSHYGVRCMTTRIPIMTSRVPVVGDVLEPTATGAFGEMDPDAVKKWMLYASRGAGSARWDGVTQGKLCRAALFVLHHAAAIGVRYPELLGAAVMVLMKLGTAACLGEHRYYTQPPNATVGARDVVYRRALRHFHESRVRLADVKEMFEAAPQPSGAVGGVAWAKCTWTVLNLEQAIRRLCVEEATHEAVGGVIEAANVLVNEAHNGGWWLNKFCSESFFDQCSTGDPRAIGGAIEGLVGMLNMPRASEEGVVVRVVKRQEKEWRERVGGGCEQVRYIPVAGSDQMIADLERMVWMWTRGNGTFEAPMGEGDRAWVLKHEEIVKGINPWVETVDGVEVVNWAMRKIVEEGVEAENSAVIRIPISEVVYCSSRDAEGVRVPARWLISAISEHVITMPVWAPVGLCEGCGWWVDQVELEAGRCRRCQGEGGEAEAVKVACDRCGEMVGVVYRSDAYEVAGEDRLCAACMQRRMRKAVMRGVAPGALARKFGNWGWTYSMCNMVGCAGMVQYVETPVALERVELSGNRCTDHHMCNGEQGVAVSLPSLCEQWGKGE